MLIKNFQKLLNLFGYQIRKKNKVFIDLEEFNSLKSRDWELIIKAENKSKKEYKDFFTNLRFYSLIQNIKYVLNNYNELKGDFVELGCWNGQSSYIISSLIKKSNKKITLHIFDSFKGISNLNKQDKSSIKIHNKFIGSENFLRQEVLKDFDFVKIYPGWIPKKFHILKDKKFSFIHIDLAMYKPTFQSLKFFYPKLKKGGIIVSNSYNSLVFPGETKAWDNFFKKKNYQFMYKHGLNTSFVIK